MTFTPPNSAGMLNSSQLMDDLSQALRHLHKALLDVEVAHFGGVSGPFELLNLAANHEQFAWLRRLSELMADIDARRDDPTPISAQEVAAVKETLETLIGPRNATSAEFRQHYLEAMQDSPTVTMAHADVRRILERRG